MKKPKRFQKVNQVVASVSGDDGDLDQADPKSREYIYSEIDTFNDDREHIPLGSEDEDNLSYRKVNEEILPLPDDSDDNFDEDEGDVYGNDYYARMAQKGDIASDIEDNEDDGLPNEKAWGKKKSSYYHADYVDKDYDGYLGSDVEMAEAEEKEATKIQKRLLQELSEADFGLDWINSADKGVTFSSDMKKEKIATDISCLSETEKLQFLKKESPELLIVIEDFKMRWTELNEKILPLLPLVVDGRIPPGPGAEYLTLKRKLTYMYCMNITFYLMIRCKDVNVRHHPVVKRLWTFHKLLEQLDPVSKKLEPDIQAVLQRLKDGKEIRPYEGPAELSNEATKPKKPKKNKQKKQVSFLEETDPKSEVSNLEKLKMSNIETDDEKEALKMYQLMKKKKTVHTYEFSDKSSVEDGDDIVEAGDNISSSFTDNEDFEVTDEKREINYQIAKNKGLTPHRKKEYRNPRVRHRVKFKKAKVRRKGQYKEPRTELQRYGGEVSGIRIGAKRGIKLN